MEDSSHELIDKLNAEEKYCYGFDSQPLSQNIVPGNNQEERPHAPTTNKKEKQGETTTSKEETSDKSPIITSTIKDPSIIDKTVKEVQKTKKGKKNIKFFFSCNSYPFLHIRAIIYYTGSSYA